MRFSLSPHLLPKLLPLLPLLACNPDKAAQDSGRPHPARDSGPTDDTGPTGDSAATFVLAQDDVLIEATLWTEGILSMDIDPQGGSGTLTYTEGFDGEAPLCEGTWPVTATPWPELCTDFGEFLGCAWALQLVTTPDTDVSTCLFPFGETAPGLHATDQGFVAWYEDQLFEGDRYDALLLFGAASEYGYSYSHVYEDVDGEDAGTEGYDPATGALFVGEENRSGTAVPTLYQVCEDVPVDSEVDFAGTGDVTGDVGCDEDLGDAWTVEAEVGQTLEASVHAAGADDPKLILVGPDGCRVGEVDDSIACRSGTTLCSSISHAVDVAGTWTVIVTDMSCERHRMTYTLSGGVR